jgi:hypothetical protein
LRERRIVGREEMEIGVKPNLGEDAEKNQEDTVKLDSLEENHVRMYKVDEVGWNGC